MKDLPDVNGAYVSYALLCKHKEDGFNNNFYNKIPSNEFVSLVQLGKQHNYQGYANGVKRNYQQWIHAMLFVYLKTLGAKVRSLEDWLMANCMVLKNIDSHL